MRKFWVVAKHEYLKITRKRSFLLGTLAMPLFFVGITALAIIVVVLTAVGIFYHYRQNKPKAETPPAAPASKS